MLVAYKGSVEAIIDVAGGRVDCYFAPISAGLPYIQPGRVRALAVTTARRSGQLPDVPTIAEAGCPGSSSFCGSGCGRPPIIKGIGRCRRTPMGDKYPVVKVAAVQAASIFLDREGSNR